MNDREWCTFIDTGRSASGKTGTWRVQGSGGEGDTIGKIIWHGPWRQYIFASERALLAGSCLRQIDRFIADQMTARSRLMRN